MAMTLRLTEEETEILRKLAERERRSMHEVVRLAILDRAVQDRRDAERDALIEGGAARYAELLDRLSR